MILFLISFLLLFRSVEGISSGLLGYCNLGPSYKYGVGSSAMPWVQPPRNASFYTLRSSDGGNPSLDPIRYTPNKWMPLHLRVLDLDRKYIGLILYAINSTDDNKKVGEWRVSADDDFQSPSTCGVNRVITHASADPKPLHQIFYFKAPPGTGRVTFRIMIKQGEQNKGNFFIPEKVLGLDEDKVINGSKVFLSIEGESCDDACKKAGSVCDLPTTTAITSAAILNSASWGDLTCASLSVAGCSSTVPMMASDSSCYYKNKQCSPDQNPAATTCAAKATGVARICVCKNSLHIQAIDSDNPLSSSSTGSASTSSSTGGGNPSTSTGNNNGSTGANNDISSSGGAKNDISSSGGVQSTDGSTGADNKSTDGSTGAGINGVRVSSGSNNRPLFIITLLSFLSVSQYQSKFFVVILLIGLFSPLPTLKAHNWMQSNSRGHGASTMWPCPPRGANPPHIQVGVNQSFPMEWVTGHGDSRPKEFRFAVVRAADMNKYIQYDDMDKYLNEAPPSALLTGPHWTKKRVWHRVAPQPNFFYPGFFEPNYLEAVPMNESDSEFIYRDPVMVHKHARNYGLQVENVYQFRYFPNKTNLDIRAEYFNPKYPKFLSVHRLTNAFPSHAHVAFAPDIANFRINAPPGDYVIWYVWGGYRDCVDVNVRAQPVKDIWGKIPNGNTPPVFAKFEHCEFTNVLNPVTPCRKLPPTRNVTQCVDECRKDRNCWGVQVVRAKNPPGTLPYSENIPIRLHNGTQLKDNQILGGCGEFTVNERNKKCNIPNPQCNLTKLAPLKDDDFICYGLAPYRNPNLDVGEVYDFGYEASDPKFYSTCYLKAFDAGFLDSGVPPTPFQPWKAGDKCVKCQTRHDNKHQPLSLVTDWYQGLTDVCTNCEAPTN